jgi:hypothetical protein
MDSEASNGVIYWADLDMLQQPRNAADCAVAQDLWRVPHRSGQRNGHAHRADV